MPKTTAERQQRHKQFVKIKCAAFDRIQRQLERCHRDGVELIGSARADIIEREFDAALLEINALKIENFQGDNW
jgi:hypothetical protein